LNVSSFDCRSLNFVKVVACSSEPFSSGFAFKVDCPELELEDLVSGACRELENLFLQNFSENSGEEITLSNDSTTCDIFFSCGVLKKLTSLSLAWLFFDHSGDPFADSVFFNTGALFSSTFIVVN